MKLKETNEGDKVRKYGEAEAFTVAKNCGRYLVLTLVKEVSNLPEWLTAAETIHELPLGAPIVSKLTKKTYRVTSIHEDFIIAVLTLVIGAKECDEWEVTAKATLEIS